MARFTYTPAAPTVGQAVTFNGSSSVCTDGLCTYEWSDDGGPTRPASMLWPLGGGQTLSFTFHEAATKYVRLVVTDALGVTATVEHNMVIATEPPTSKPPTEEDPPTETEQPKTEPPLEKEAPKTEPPVEKEAPKPNRPLKKKHRKPNRLRANRLRRRPTASTSPARVAIPTPPTPACPRAPS